MTRRSSNIGALYSALAGPVRAFDEQLFEVLQALGLSPTEYRLLDMVAEAGFPAQHQIADEFGVSRPRINQVIAPLEAKGFVLRRRYKQFHEVGLTDEGDKVRRAAERQRDDLLRQHFGALSEGDRTTLLDILVRMG